MPGASQTNRLRTLVQIARYPIAFCIAEIVIYFALIVILDHYWLALPLSESVLIGAGYVLNRVKLFQIAIQLILLQLVQRTSWRYSLFAALGATILGLAIGILAIHQSFDRVVNQFSIELERNYIGIGFVMTVSAVAAWSIVRRWDFVVRNHP